MEELYIAIDQRNQRPQAQPEALRPDLYTRALWTMGFWTLERPDVFQALQTIREEGIVYEPSGLGELHWTLLQFQTFPVTPTYEDEPLLQTCKEILDDSPPIHITFRGISRTRYGLFLCGYPNYDVNTVRDRLRLASSGEMVEPHPQDIFHSTLFRFTQEPSEKALAVLNKLVETWRNTVIATMRPDTWEFGYGTWTQRETDRIVKGSWAAKPPLWILHRGLKNGPNKVLENTEVLLWDRIREGWDVEVDCWYKEGSIWLGHDQPTHKAQDLRLLACPKAWIHCKNLDMLQYMAEHRPGAPFFSHDTDEAVLTSNGYIWCYPGVQGTTKSILVMPERVPSMAVDYSKINGICSDYTSIRR